MISTKHSEIWERIIEPNKAHLARSQAKAILEMKFQARDVARMNSLARRSNNGTLTPSQRVELENYVQIGHVLTILHSKARSALQARARTTRRLPAQRRRAS